MYYTEEGPWGPAMVEVNIYKPVSHEISRATGIINLNCVFEYMLIELKRCLWAAT